MKRRFFSINCVVVFLALSSNGSASAATVDVWQMYDGTARPREEISRLTAGSGVHITSIDGRKAAWYTGWGTLQLEMLPGKHEAVVRYHQGDLPLFGVFWPGMAARYSIDSQTLAFDAAPGKTYTIEANASGGRWAATVVEGAAPQGTEKRSPGCWRLEPKGQLERFESRTAYLVLPTGEKAEYKLTFGAQTYDASGRSVGYRKLKPNQTVEIATNTCAEGKALAIFIEKE